MQRPVCCLLGRKVAGHRVSLTLLSSRVEPVGRFDDGDVLDECDIVAVPIVYSI